MASLIKSATKFTLAGVALQFKNSDSQCSVGGTKIAATQIQFVPKIKKKDYV